MSVNTIQSDLLFDLSTEEQQLISGGKEGTIRAFFCKHRYPSHCSL